MGGHGFGAADGPGRCGRGCLHYSYGEAAAGTPPRRLGQLKWLLYFLSTVFATETFISFEPMGLVRAGLLWLFAGVLALGGFGGIAASVRGDFSGIMAASRLSAFGLAGLALAPLIQNPPLPLSVAAEYIALLRSPLLSVCSAALLPILAFFTGARALLRGLFDVTPAGMLALALAAVATGGTVAACVRLTYLHAWDRVPGLAKPASFPVIPGLPSPWSRASPSSAGRSDSQSCRNTLPSG